MVLPVRSLRTGLVRRKSCFVYIMDEERRIGVPSDMYVTIVLAGYKSIRFNDRFMADAIKKSKEAVKSEGQRHYD